MTKMSSGVTIKQNTQVFTLNTTEGNFEHCLSKIKRQKVKLNQEN